MVNKFENYFMRFVQFIRLTWRLRQVYRRPRRTIHESADPTSVHAVKNSQAELQHFQILNATCITSYNKIFSYKTITSESEKQSCPERHVTCTTLLKSVADCASVESPDWCRLFRPAPLHQLQRSAAGKERHRRRSFSFEKCNLERPMLFLNYKNFTYQADA